MQDSSHTPLFVFAYFMMEYVIPYDTRLSSLVKKRDFKRHSAFFSLMRQYANNYEILEDETSNEFFQKLIELTIPIYRIYILQLLTNFLKKDESKKEKVKEKVKEVDELNSLFQKKSCSREKLFYKYRELILGLEKELNISALTLCKKQAMTHISSEIYDIDFQKLIEILKQTNQALDYLYLELNKYPDLHSQKDKEQEVDYLIKVVNFELWNFISHISHAFTSLFKTPLNFISDLEKARSHLRRSIMDIYDGLIVDIYHCKITSEYLNLRNDKIMSLGQAIEMNSLSENLRDYYLKISKKETVK